MLCRSFGRNGRRVLTVVALRRNVRFAQLPLALELVMTQRGACWDWGIPNPPTKPHKHFLWESFKISTAGVILFDLLATFIKHPAVTPNVELLSLDEASSGVLGRSCLLVCE